MVMTKFYQFLVVNLSGISGDKDLELKPAWLKSNEKQANQRLCSKIQKPAVMQKSTSSQGAFMTAALQPIENRNVRHLNSIQAYEEIQKALNTGNHIFRTNAKDCKNAFIPRKYLNNHA